MPNPPRASKPSRLPVQHAGSAGLPHRFFLFLLDFVRGWIAGGVMADDKHVLLSDQGQLHSVEAFNRQADAATLAGGSGHPASGRHIRRWGLARTHTLRP